LDQVKKITATPGRKVRPDTSLGPGQVYAQTLTGLALDRAAPPLGTLATALRQEVLAQGQDIAGQLANDLAHRNIGRRACATGECLAGLHRETS